MTRKILAYQSQIIKLNIQVRALKEYCTHIDKHGVPVSDVLELAGFETPAIFVHVNVAMSYDS